MAPPLLANFPYFLPKFLKDAILDMMVTQLTRIISSEPFVPQRIEPAFEHRQSPLMVPVPAHLISSTKEHLTVSKYGNVNIQRRASRTCREDCAICLMELKECEEVRLLSNCKHVFHKDCIDAWIDKCKTTCPVCRSELLPGQGEKVRSGEDPWRRERMIYVFGEDLPL